MGSLHRTATRALALLAIAILFSGWLTPVSTLADTNLVIGGSAVVAYANGDDVRVRESAGADGNILQLVSEGATVTVLDGPVSDSDGNLWYFIETADGTRGYIISDYLAYADGAGQATAPVNPESVAIGQAIIAWTDGDGVRCRNAASGNSSVITVVPEGTVVDLTGPVQNGVWQPINCGGQSGFVHTDFVSYSTDAPAETRSVETSSVDADTASTESSEVVGGATVSGTGNGLRCRAGASLNATIITVLSDGSWVELRASTVGKWQGVICAGQNGYVHSSFLDYESEDAATSGGNEATGTAYVAGTNGDGVRCRTGASTTASIISVLKEGTEVTLRGSASGSWQPVFCAGENGWVSAQYLSDSPPANGAGNGGGTGKATINGTDGDGARCRTEPSTDATVIAVLREGARVTLNGDQQGNWQPVLCKGSEGWVFAEYVDTTGGGGAQSDAPSNSSLSQGDSAVVSDTNGQGVRLRSNASANASIITVIPEGAKVTVGAGSTGDWVAVRYKGNTGFVHMDYLQKAARDAGNNDGGNTGGGASLSTGDHAVTTSTVNLRYDPSYSGGVAAVAPKGTVVEVTGPASSGFYPVDWDGLQGYMHGDYLKYTNADLSERGGSGEPGNNGGGNSGGGDSNSPGGRIVSFAMQYLGYPYVWATHGPSSFDCSGFTNWVILNTLGINITYSNVTQYAYGYEVSRDALQPGDLVFFQNTYTWGNSHVGIYIGGGQFIHAENESTGVVISNLNSSYYGPRWYGARRLV